MAIPFLNNINLSNNELQNAKLHITGTAPNAAPGQIYFDSSDDIAKYYSTASSTWISLIQHVPTSSTFIILDESPATGAKRNLTAALSATGTPNSTTYLRGDNAWSPISGISGTTYDLDSLQVGANAAITLVGSDATLDTVTLVAGTNITITDDGSNNITIDSANPDQTITLTGEVTGSGTTSIATTVANGVLDVANFNASAVVTVAEGSENNDNDTTLPTSAAVKAYVDSSVAGGLIYQGGYDAATNTPNLDATPIAGIKKGWTYTVTVDGLFFTEQVRVGDVIIAEIDSPTTLADWTTVQNNIDLASLTQVGIGNVNAGTGISVTYASGTATVTNTQTNANNTFAGTIAASGAVTHSLGTKDVIVQLYDIVTDETVYADVDRNSTSQVTVTFASTPTNSVRVLVQKIG